MRYVSTRSTAPGKGFSDILLEGLAADGGLYLPETYPQVSTETLEQWRALLHGFYDPLPSVTYFADPLPLSEPAAGA